VSNAWNATTSCVGTLASPGALRVAAKDALATASYKMSKTSITNYLQFLLLLLRRNGHCDGVKTNLMDEIKMRRSPNVVDHGQFAYYI